MKTEAKLFALKYKDLAKGFVVAILTVVMTGAMTGLTSVPPHFPTMPEIQALLLTGLGAGIAYLTKNFFSNSDGQMLKKEAETPKV